MSGGDVQGGGGKAGEAAAEPWLKVEGGEDGEGDGRTGVFFVLQLVRAFFGGGGGSVPWIGIWGQRLSTARKQASEPTGLLERLITELQYI
jgi:hypothetical protein